MHTYSASVRIWHTSRKVACGKRRRMWLTLYWSRHRPSLHIFLRGLYQYSGSKNLTFDLSDNAGKCKNDGKGKPTEPVASSGLRPCRTPRYANCWLRARRLYSLLEEKVILGCRSPGTVSISVFVLITRHMAPATSVSRSRWHYVPSDFGERNTGSSAYGLEHWDLQLRES